MTAVNYTVRIDDDVRAQAQELFESMGLTLSAAINVFLRRCIADGGFPFELRKIDGVELGAVEASEGGKELPDSITWPRNEDGTLFDPDKIGSKLFADVEEGAMVRAHRLCYDGGMWFILDDDEGRPLASTVPTPAGPMFCGVRFVARGTGLKPFACYDEGCEDVEL